MTATATTERTISPKRTIHADPHSAGNGDVTVTSDRIRRPLYSYNELVRDVSADGSSVWQQYAYRPADAIPAGTLRRRRWEARKIREDAISSLAYLTPDDGADEDSARRWDERDTQRLFIFRGSVYDLYEFTAVTGGNAASFWALNGGKSWVKESGFDAYQTESAFSAVLAKQTDDDYGDPCVIVGYAHW